jgi:hypothetical protein
MLLACLLLVALVALPSASGWYSSRLERGAVRWPPVAAKRARARSAPAAALPNPAQAWFDFRASLEAAGASVVFERGALRIFDPDLAAFVGGAVGVIGTLESIMSRRRAVRERLTCVYCDGAGTLTCGVCLGSGRDARSAPCPNCKGAGTVACVSCQGSGNSVLLASDRNLIRELAGLGTMQGEMETEIDR